MYECHITFKGTDWILLKGRFTFEWKYSKIKGDPLLGDKVFCYLTKHGDDPKELIADAKDICKSLRLTPIRLKIEQVIFDTKTDVDMVGVV